MGGVLDKMASSEYRNKQGAPNTGNRVCVCVYLLTYLLKKCL